MDCNYNQEILPANVLHWNYRGFTEFPIHKLDGEEAEVTDIYLKENLISRVPKEICRLENLESLYLSGNDITELPGEIAKLRCLKCLDVSGNRLRRLPGEIGEMKSLKFLILDENELTELPLRLNEIRGLRYLSVCGNHFVLSIVVVRISESTINNTQVLKLLTTESDQCCYNQLQWLPQRPMFNYHHCEFRFWRNTSLKTIPYLLWYHMFRDQQTRSLNIGCLSIQTDKQVTKTNNIRLKIVQDSREWLLQINAPTQLENIINRNTLCPPSLFELTRRRMYEIVSDIAKKETNNRDINIFSWREYQNNNGRNLEQTFEEFNINNTYDINGNNTVPSNKIHSNRRDKSYCVPGDVIDEYFSFMPQFMKDDFRNGPIARCDNIMCKKPIFNFVIYEFCFGKLILIDNIADVVLSATFCSKSCDDSWRLGKDVIPWSLVEDQ